MSPSTCCVSDGSHAFANSAFDCRFRTRQVTRAPPSTRRLTSHRPSRPVPPVTNVGRSTQNVLTAVERTMIQLSPSRAWVLSGILRIAPRVMAPLIAECKPGRETQQTADGNSGRWRKSCIGDWDDSSRFVEHVELIGAERGFASSVDRLPAGLLKQFDNKVSLGRPRCPTHVPEHGHKLADYWITRWNDGILIVLKVVNESDPP